MVVAAITLIIIRVLAHLLGSMGVVPQPRRPRLFWTAVLSGTLFVAGAVIFHRGVWPGEAARRLGVSRQSANSWHHLSQVSGAGGPQKAETTGRPSFLTTADVRRVRSALLDGARANGFSTDLWTVGRVTEVIARVTGAECHPVSSGNFCAGWAGP